MQGVYFIPFPKPPKETIKKKNPKMAKTLLDKCKRWIHACGRPKEDFNVKKINRSTYICSKHFVDQGGPTDEHPDPIISRQVGFRKQKY